MEGRVDRLVEDLQNLLPTIVAQVGNHANNQGNNGNQNDNVIDDNVIDDNVQTRGREAAVGMTWEDFKALMREEFCPNNEMQKLELEFWCHAMAGEGHAACTDKYHKLARMVAATEPTTIQSAVLKARVLTDEAIRTRSLKRNTKKRGNNGESSKDGNARDDKKRYNTGRAFTTTTYPVRRENAVNARNPTTARRELFEYVSTDHYKAACPRLNCAPRQGGNRLNQALVVDGGQGHGNNGSQAHGRAFMLGA
ncbi:hypothetical protein Tco_1186261 [Tanacetum coccineum]